MDLESQFPAGFLETWLSLALVARFFIGRMAGMTDRDKLEDWRQRPWAIALLILLAIAFGIQIVLASFALLTISTGVMLFCWVALLITSLRKRKQ
jgi:hypothetical protein